MNFDTIARKRGYDRIDPRNNRVRVGPPTARPVFDRARLVGWDSPATQFRSSTTHERPLSCLVRESIEPGVCAVLRSPLADGGSA